MNEISDLSEELFCLRYELNTLANVLLRQESERWIPGFLYEGTEHSHLERYKLACKFSSNKKVIDIACGSGKGSNLIATAGHAEGVNGFDIQQEAIRYANWRYGNENVSFDIKDAEAIGIVNSYDLAVSFETVEHLPDYRSFFKSIQQCLKAGGLFLVSTPISKLTIDNKPANPYHIQEWGFQGFQDLLSEYFDIQQVFVQLYPQTQQKPSLPAPGIYKRVYNKIKRTLKPPPPVQSQVVEPALAQFSKIEEYKGQYTLEELGNSRIGYQIILAKIK